MRSPQLFRPEIPLRSLVHARVDSLRALRLCSQHLRRPVSLLRLRQLSHLDFLLLFRQVRPPRSPLRSHRAIQHLNRLPSQAVNRRPSHRAFRLRNRPVCPVASHRLCLVATLHRSPVLSRVLFRHHSQVQLRVRSPLVAHQASRVCCLQHNPQARRLRSPVLGRVDSPQRGPQRNRRCNLLLLRLASQVLFPVPLRPHNRVLNQVRNHQVDHRPCRLRSPVDSLLRSPPDSRAHSPVANPWVALPHSLPDSRRAVRPVPRPRTSPVELFTPRLPLLCPLSTPLCQSWRCGQERHRRH